MMSVQPAMVFEGLHKEFRLGLGLTRVHAVRGVDLTVERGEIFGYLGPNGAGKTTSMKVAMGLIQPTSGKVSILGGNIDDVSIRHRVGYLPEHPYFYDYLTAHEILDYYGRLYQIGRQERRRRIGELLALVDLSDAADRTLRRFSKGMLQRVGIAQALINDPELVVLDEPLSGLDPMGRKEVRSIILSLRDVGKTVFFSTHILHDIETICDRVAIIVEGRIVRLGALQELLASSSNQVEVVAQGASTGALEAVGNLGAEVSSFGQGVQVVVNARKLDAVLRCLLDSEARITHVQPRRDSLEALFVRTAQEGTDGR